ncbi:MULTISPECIES: right-handed parallel beta-helix repeat-containing protein [unclassified Coleofasciculus]|nr:MULTISPECIES: right-handed parallel beta-helix repeat-containing protein [unclassified Coleofasciculus]
MGDRTTLSGFDIPNAGTNAIQGTSIDTVTIRDNAIANSTQTGILLFDVTGQVTVTDNSIDTTGGFGNSGFFIGNTGGSVDLTVVRNQIANTTDSGIDILLFNTAEATANLSDNTLSGNNTDGIRADMFGNSTATLTIDNNTVSDNETFGIGIRSNESATAITTLTNNTVSDNDFGIGIRSNESATAIATLTNNTVSGNGFDSTDIDTATDGIATATRGDSSLQLLLKENTATNNARFGISILSDYFIRSV